MGGGGGEERPGPGGYSRDSRGWRSRIPEGVDRRGPRVPGDTPAPGVAVPPTCRLRASVSTRPFQQWRFPMLPSSEWGPAGAAGACLHQSNGCCRSRGPHPAGDGRLRGNSGHIPGARGAGDSRTARAQRRAGFPGRAHGAGPGPETNGARVLGGAGSGPGIPVAAAVFSGAGAPSAGSGPSRLSEITLKRLRPPGG